MSINRKLSVLFITLVLIAGTVLPSQAKNAIDGVKTETICFTAHNGADPAAVPITGTLFYYGNYEPNSKVIVAVHGVGSVRSVWDGGQIGPKQDDSFVRPLARAGYVVITFDRLGYGESPYNLPGAGYKVTMDNQLGVLREIITQIKEGSYTKTTTTCSNGAPAEFGFDNPILIGHSAGAVLIESYAGLYHDVSAIIPMTFSNAGWGSAANELLNTWLIPNIYSGQDYVTFFPPNPDGRPVSSDCLRFFFYTPGASPVVYNSVCANENLIPTPSGEFITIGDFMAETRERIKKIGNLPVLMVFADHDTIFLGPKEATPTDPDTQSLEIDYWQQNCKCDFSTFTQTDSGHMLMFHESSSSTTSAIIDWLRSRGLAPREEKDEDK